MFSIFYVKPKLNLKLRTKWIVDRYFLSYKHFFKIKHCRYQIDIYSNCNNILKIIDMQAL